MNRKLKMVLHSPLLGFGFGFFLALILSGHVIKAGIFGILGGVVQGILMMKWRGGSRTRAEFLKEEKAYLPTIAALSAAVLRTHKNAIQGTAFVESRFRKNYPPALAEKAVQMLRKEIGSPSNLKNHTDLIAFEFDTAGKMQLMNFLINICAVDGIVTDAELACLRNISKGIELNQKTLDSILAMYRFRRQQDETQQQKPVHADQLITAYQVLELTPSATDAEIKKAYKRLAIAHHPDKVAHLGEEEQKLATEKFKIISAAYELICKKRGIS